MVGVLDDFGHVADVFGGFVGGQSRRGRIADDLAEVSAFDVFHRVEVLALVDADFVDGDHARMAEVGGGFGFGLEAVYVGFGGQVAGQDHFDGDGAVEADLAGLVDDAHAALGDFFEQLVVAEVADESLRLGSEPLAEPVAPAPAEPVAPAERLGELLHAVMVGEEGG